MEDWNAIVGEGEEGKAVSDSGLGKRNKMGTRLINFGKEKTMVPGNTSIKHQKRLKYTWIPRLHEVRYQLHYILVQQ